MEQENNAQFPNYYQLLGIDFKADTDEIKRIMKKKAQEQSVDLAVLQGCKEHLLDAQKRAEYDKELLNHDAEFKAQIVQRERELAKKRRESKEAIAMGKPDPNAPPEPEPKEKKRGCLDFVFLIVTGLVLSVIFYNCSGNRSGSSNISSRTTHSEGSASYACKEAVKAVMKAPTQATVSFDKFTLNGSTYTFTGTVDAPNSFGVMLRNNVSCTATHQSGSNYSTSVQVQQ